MNKKQVFAVLLCAAAIFSVAGCGEQDVNADSDTIACVFDGSDTGGHRFKQIVQPGEHIKTSGEDDVVYIPTSNRFYNMTSTENRDTLAPAKLLAYAADNTPLWVEGVLRFHFNTTGNKPCEWYSKHGRRNAPLSFNARGTAEQARAGWFRFLAENMGDTMRQVVHDRSTDWSWQQLVYGNDAERQGANSPKLTQPSVSVAYGVFIGQQFTKYLKDNLGGDYFCGVQPAVTGPGEDKNCPPIYFQVLSAYPKDENLTAEHEKVQRLQSELETQKREAALRAENRASLIEDARAQQKVLEAQIENARLRALADEEIQHCLVLAKVKLDCEGHWQPVYVNGQKAGG